MTSAEVSTAHLDHGRALTSSRPVSMRNSMPCTVSGSPPFQAPMTGGLLTRLYTDRFTLSCASLHGQASSNWMLGNVVNFFAEQSRHLSIS